MANLTLSDLVVRDGAQAWARLDDEVVALSVQRGAYYALGQPGTRIWELVEHPVTVSDLVARLCEEFDVEPAACRGDVLTFLDELREEDLLQVVG